MLLYLTTQGVIQCPLRTFRYFPIDYFDNIIRKDARIFPYEPNIVAIVELGKYIN